MEYDMLQNIPFEGFEDNNGKRYVYISDMDTGMSRWSKGAIDYFGIEVEDEYFANAKEIWLTHVHPRDREAYLEDINALFAGEKDFHNVDYRARNRFGEYVSCTCKGRIVPKANGEGKLFVGTIENNEKNERFDSVTGLYNVFSFLMDTQSYLQSDDSAIILMIGINRFGDINKQYNYETGNELLKSFSNDLLLRIRGEIPEVARVYRMDGTKFALAIQGENLCGDLVERIYARIEDLAHAGYLINGHRIYFTISGGFVDISSKHASEFSIQTSLEYVLEESKHRKYGELVHFNDSGMNQDERKLAMLEEIRSCVFDNMRGFYLCYQPLVCVETGKVLGTEALLRWKNEEYGEVPPGMFIPWLENDPCFYTLGLWIMEQALKDTKKLQELLPNMFVDVNVSIKQIERSGFGDEVARLLKETQLDSRLLCIEITERTASLDLQFLRDELVQYREHNVKIALDDFGTGLSSLNLLLELPVDFIKIDRNFVKDILDNRSQQAIVQAVLNCAHDLKMGVCIEGIETGEMGKFLKNYGTDFYQGFYYARPMPYDKLVAYLKELA